MLVCTDLHALIKRKIPPWGDRWNIAHTKTTHDRSVQLQLRSCAHEGLRNEWAGQKAGGESPVRGRSVLKCQWSLMDAGSTEEIWPAERISEHLAGRSKQLGENRRTRADNIQAFYGELQLAKSVASFKISS